MIEAETHLPDRQAGLCLIECRSTAPSMSSCLGVEHYFSLVTGSDCSNSSTEILDHSPVPAFISAPYQVKSGLITCGNEKISQMARTASVTYCLVMGL